jgi:hypothetical protein
MTTVPGGEDVDDEAERPPGTVEGDHLRVGTQARRGTGPDRSEWGRGILDVRDQVIVRPGREHKGYDGFRRDRDLAQPGTHWAIHAANTRLVEQVAINRPKFVGERRRDGLTGGSLNETPLAVRIGLQVVPGPIWTSDKVSFFGVTPQWSVGLRFRRIVI